MGYVSLLEGSSLGFHQHIFPKNCFLESWTSKAKSMDGFHGDGKNHFICMGCRRVYKADDDI